MNVTCDNCQKRYAIADEKVRGKSVRIRCKNCQTIIHVPALPGIASNGVPASGAVAASPAPAPSRTFSEEVTKAAPPPDPAVPWFAMVKGKQEGPFDLRALEGKIHGGLVTQRTYLWQQGMADWKRGAEIPELQGIFRTDGAAPPPPAARVAAKDPFGELFSDQDLAKPSALGGAPEDPTERKARAAAAAEEDPFDALGKVDPKQLPPPGEATQFFIAQAGVNKRNPLWKFALFAGVFVLLPLAGLVALYVLVPPEVLRRVDEQGNVVQESVFSKDGLSHLGEFLSGKAKQAKKPPVRRASAPTPSAPLPRSKGEHTAPSSVGTIVSTDDLPTSEPKKDGLAGLFEKTDTGPRVRKDVEARPSTDTTTGGLSPEQVSKVVAQMQPSFQQCIEAELRKNPKFRGGKIIIVATVMSSGIVTKTEINRREIDVSELGGCLKSRAKRMVFAAFSGDETDVEIPLILGASAM